MPSQPPRTPTSGINRLPGAGYDDWLKAELAFGLADVQAGRVTLLDKVRKEFGLE